MRIVDIPLIGKSEFIMEAIKIQENYETLLIYILDPIVYPTSLFVITI